MMINTKNLNEVRKEIIRLKKLKKEIVVKAQGDEFNRKILENKDVDVIFGLEMHNRRDYLKQRDSGLNEFMCKLAKKNGIKIGVDLKGLRGLKGVEKARVLARVMQNIGLCKRVGSEVVFDIGVDGKRGLSKLDVESLRKVLGEY